MKVESRKWERLLKELTLEPQLEFAGLALARNRNALPKPQVQDKQSRAIVNYGDCAEMQMLGYIV